MMFYCRTIHACDVLASSVSLTLLNTMHVNCRVFSLARDAHQL